VAYYLSVFVPRADHHEVGHIEAGSGIVGLTLADGRVAIHYEGNRYGAVNMQRLADRVAQAAARLRFADATVAKAIVPVESLVEVGRYDGVEGRVELAGENAERELCRWLRVEEFDPAELERSEIKSTSA
jgi:hypothetical protein